MDKPKTAVITGATGGIGREVASLFLKSGVSVYLLGRNFEKLESIPELNKAIVQKKAQCCSVDLNNESEILKTAELINNNEEKIDFLIHCAAFCNHSAFADADIMYLDKSYRINVRAPYLLSQQFLPKLRAANGSILFLNSNVVAGLGKENAVNYASTKSALKTMADCIRQEVNSDGIRVVTLMMGKTATQMQIKLCEDEGIPYKPQQMIQPLEIAQVIFQTATAPSSLEIMDVLIRPSVSYN